MKTTLTETATHTPAPWHLELDQEEQGAFLLISTHGLVICSREVGTPTGAEGIANARLIAAAPDLLAALKKIAANGINADDFSHRIAREAIAKAEG